MIQLPEIPHANLPGIPEELFRAKQCGEMSEKDYHAGTAIWAAEHLDQFLPPRFLALSENLRNYCEARISARWEYMPESAHKLGIWHYTVIRTISEYQGDLSFLIWCKEKLIEVKAYGLVSKVDAMIDRFWREKPPLADAQLASRTLRLDSDAKRRKANDRGA